MDVSTRARYNFDETDREKCFSLFIFQKKKKSFVKTDAFRNIKWEENSKEN